MSAILVTDATFARDVLAADRPVVVDFWAPWCGPCRQLAPALDALAESFAGRAVIAKLDIDANPGSASAWGVRSVPTLMVFKGGAPVATRTGVAPESALGEWIAAAL